MQAHVPDGNGTFKYRGISNAGPGLYNFMKKLAGMDLCCASRSRVRGSHLRAGNCDYAITDGEFFFVNSTESSTRNDRSHCREDVQLL